MSDQQKPPNATSIFASEIVQLLQHKLESQTLKSLSDLYKNQVTDLEFQVSDLKAQLMAKDHEIQTLKEKLHSRSQSCQFSRQVLPTLLSTEKLQNSSNSEIQRLQTLLRAERDQNLQFEKQIQQLQSNLEKSQTLLFSESVEKIEKMHRTIITLSEENEFLRAKLGDFELIEPSTAHKSLNSSAIKLSTVSIDSESVSITESTPRFEGSIQDVQESPGFRSGFGEGQMSPRKILNPEPPKTRCQSDYPKKVALPGRSVRYVNCNLSEILASPVKNRNLAEFCPSSLRKHK